MHISPDSSSEQDHQRIQGKEEHEIRGRASKD